MSGSMIPRRSPSPDRLASSLKRQYLSRWRTEWVCFIATCTLRQSRLQSHRATSVHGRPQSESVNPRRWPARPNRSSACISLCSPQTRTHRQTWLQLCRVHRMPLMVHFLWTATPRRVLNKAALQRWRSRTRCRARMAQPTWVARELFYNPWLAEVEAGTPASWLARASKKQASRHSL